MQLRCFLILSFGFLLCTSATLPAQYLIESEFLSNTSKSEVLNFPGFPNDYDVDAYKLTYRTTDVRDDTTIASGLIVLPVDGVCDRFPMGVYCHGTVLKKYNVPSNENFEGEIVKTISSAGFIGLAPDYLGYGESPGLHPYHHARSQATATVDLIRAGREFLETKNIQDNHEVFITGYSQGGHAAMSTLEYAQENDLMDELGIVAGAPASGAYNLSGTHAEVLINQGATYEYMGYVAFMVLAYELVYENIYDEPNAFFEPQYVDDINKYFDGMQNQYEMLQVHMALPNTAQALLQDSVLQELQNDQDHPLWQAYRENDNYDWTPEMPLRLYYCSGDQQVSPQNSLIAETTMLNNGAEDVMAINALPGADHVGCVLPALVGIYQFVDGLDSPCTVSSISEVETAESISIYPNPASTTIRLENLASVQRIQLINSRGVLQTIHQLETGREELTIPVHDLSSGLYFLQFYGEDGLLEGKKIIVE